MNHVSEHTTGVGNKRFPACLYYDFKGRISWKAVLPFLREQRWEKAWKVHSRACTSCELYMGSRGAPRQCQNEILAYELRAHNWERTRNAIL